MQLEEETQASECTESGAPTPVGKGASLAVHELAPVGVGDDVGDSDGVGLGDGDGVVPRPAATRWRPIRRPAVITSLPLRQ